MNKRDRMRRRQLGTIGSVPSLARALERVAPRTLDMQTPAFWRSVWDESKK